MKSVRDRMWCRGIGEWVYYYTFDGNYGTIFIGYNIISEQVYDCMMKALVPLDRAGVCVDIRFIVSESVK